MSKNFVRGRPMMASTKRVSQRAWRPMVKTCTLKNLTTWVWDWIDLMLNHHLISHIMTASCQTIMMISHIKVRAWIMTWNCKSFIVFALRFSPPLSRSYGCLFLANNWTKQAADNDNERTLKGHCELSHCWTTVAKQTLHHTPGLVRKQSLHHTYRRKTFENTAE